MLFLKKLRRATRWWQEFKHRRRYQKMLKRTNNRDARYRRLLKRKFQQALRRAKKHHTIPEAQLIYLRSKKYPGLALELKQIFAKRLAKINDPLLLIYYRDKLCPCDELRDLLFTLKNVPKNFVGSAIKTPSANSDPATYAEAD